MYQRDTANANIPNTPFGDYWVFLSNDGAIYQEIDTYDASLQYDITFLAGQRDATCAVFYSPSRSPSGPGVILRMLRMEHNWQTSREPLSWTTAA